MLTTRPSLQRLRNLWLLIAIVCVASLVVVFKSEHRYSFAQLRAAVAATREGHENPEQKIFEPAGTAVVVASQQGDNVTWLTTFSAWEKFVYVTDDPAAELTIPINKGRESMVYLTYIIDNYDRLANVSIFLHPNQYQWHNDDPFYDGASVLSRLNLAYVRVQGYVNLRCSWSPGCPVEIRPKVEAEARDSTSDPNSNEARAGAFYKQAYEGLFPGAWVPDSIGAPCCAQFAVSSSKIRERSLSDYHWFRDWLIETSLNDDLSGRILEYTWHIIFGQETIFCPNSGDCYCKLFGLCRLPCESAGSCQAAYTMPPYSTLPEHWPEIDWDGNARNVTDLRLKFELESRPGPPRPYESNS